MKGFEDGLAAEGCLDCTGKGEHYLENLNSHAFPSFTWMHARKY